MSRRRVYLDYAASAPVKPAVRAAMCAAMDVAGNPSSVHADGRAARRVMEDAREAVAAMVGAAPADVIFTASGTEANNLVLRGFPGRRVFVSALEHDSALSAAEDAVRIPARPDGAVDLDALEILLRDDAARGGPPALISVMLVNNETGVIQPAAAVGALARRYGALFHCDAAQAAGKLPVDVAELGCDAATLSAHKLGGPAGVGAVVLARGAAPQALIRGGGQERGVRAGTQNLIGAAGFGAAAALAGDELADAGRRSALRDGIETALTAAVPGLIVAGAGSGRVGSVSCLVFPAGAAGERSAAGTGESMVMRLDLAGVSVSAGAACSSGKVKPSHVLAAMGFSPASSSAAVRVSLGWGSTDDDARRFIDAYAACCAGRRPTL